MGSNSHRLLLRAAELQVPCFRGWERDRAQPRTQAIKAEAQPKLQRRLLYSCSLQLAPQPGHSVLCCHVYRLQVICSKTEQGVRQQCGLCSRSGSSPSPRLRLCDRGCFSHTTTTRANMIPGCTRARGVLISLHKASVRPSGAGLPRRSLARATRVC